ncbi:hypothetical protein Taro_046815, partial [Colocasia esculenta]|nr:hypothetical protein [Colocasia esculenta]
MTEGSDLGLWVWCWLVSIVLWLVFVEQQLDLSSVTARVLRWSCAPWRSCGETFHPLCLTLSR